MRSQNTIQQAAEPLAPTNPAGASPRRVPIDQPILESLMIPLAMVVINEFLERPAEVALTERHQSIEALVFDRPHESLGVGVGIGRVERSLHHVHPGLAKQPSHIPAPFPITSQISTR
jgi:hypothetical protein